MPEQRIKLEYELLTQTPFHISTGNAGGLYDRTVVKDHEGHLYIPGSSVKGVLRTEVRRLGEAWGIPNCGSSYGNKQCFKSNLCLVCNLFGSTFSGERLFFDDCRLTEKQRQLFSTAPGGGPFAQTQPRTQIKINRLRGVVEEGHLFTSEYANAGLVFVSSITGKIDATGLVNGGTRFYPELVILLTGLKTINRIGSGRSRGHGRVVIKVIGLWVNGEKMNVNAQYRLLPEAVNALRGRRTGDEVSG